MGYQPLNTSEQKTALAFTSQSAIFDVTSSQNTVIQYKRLRVRQHVKAYLSPNSRILELNSGTGEDAIWFAKNECQVHATDISAGMMQVLIQKIKNENLEKSVTYEFCSFTELDNLSDPGPYDVIFSNFAGLNCTGELFKALSAFDKLLKPGGMATIVMLPPVCLWEILLLFRGKYRTAFRRLFSKKGAAARVEGHEITCWYYHPSHIISALKTGFDVFALEGLCTLVPPSYIQDFPEKYPRLYKILENKEDRLKNKWPWKFIGDYFILSLKKKQ
jgi:ubiquinone/menaquinone biosynthesis C-methylase UbiE